MKNVLFVISFILTIPNSYCQSFSSNTIPEQINGGSPIVLGIENSNDVKIVCEIFYGGNPVITEWRFISGGDTTLLRFDINGDAINEGSQPFSITGEVLAGSQLSQANLTIIDFTSSLDTSVLECYSPPNTHGNFTLRIIGIVDNNNNNNSIIFYN